MRHDDPATLPPHLLEELSKLPRYADRRTLAATISRLLFPISHRSLEAWPLQLRRVNGYAVADTAEVLRIAWRKFSEGPVTMQGRKSLQGSVPWSRRSAARAVLDGLKPAADRDPAA